MHSGEISSLVEIVNKNARVLSEGEEGEGIPKGLPSRIWVSGQAKKRDSFLEKSFIRDKRVMGRAVAPTSLVRWGNTMAQGKAR